MGLFSRKPKKADQHDTELKRVESRLDAVDARVRVLEQTVKVYKRER